MIMALRRHFLCLALPLTLLALAPAFADEGEWVPPVRHAETLKECGECHMAFQPALLPAGSWRAIMGNLSDHFGEDASLPPATAASIEHYLVAGAGRGDPSLLRITEQRWWRHEHDFSPGRFARPEVRSKINCAACHQGAENGYYEDD